MYIDKQTAAKRQINCAIRSIFNGECAVSNHVITMATKEVLEQFAAKKKQSLRANMGDYIKDEHQAEFRRFYKERFNYLKHSDHDADMEVDTTNLQIANEIETFFNVLRYEELFGASTAHMHIFALYMRLRHPVWFKDSLEVTYQSLIRQHKNKSRRELCGLMAATLSNSDAVKSELLEVSEMSLQEEAPMAEREAGDRGKFFSRLTA